MSFTDVFKLTALVHFWSTLACVEDDESNTLAALTFLHCSGLTPDFGAFVMPKDSGVATSSYKLINTILFTRSIGTF